MPMKIIDVAFKAPSGQVNVHLNDFNNRAIGVDNLGTGTVDAVQNWWGCALGPLSKRCASITGPNVMFTPWLLFPFNGDNR